MKHFSVDGQLEFKALLCAPRLSIFRPVRVEEEAEHIKLHVRRLLIMDDCDELMTEWANFEKQVVDSEDLPFTIFRWTLQQNKILHVFDKSPVKVLGYFRGPRQSRPEGVHAPVDCADTLQEYLVRAHVAGFRHLCVNEGYRETKPRA